ncbi:Vesicle transport v-SNARE family protein [Hibiscus syriacus]|uniref:Vesicle transport v-SNARE family protein n=1 Tax=Hibiscus syriacus TaxID=106335 RepID=A0A6A2ZBC2_HIBSY|nr:Vesicle transport v-SNARE family protein [Hibiscus syriacus]
MANPPSFPFLFSSLPSSLPSGMCPTICSRHWCNALMDMYGNLDGGGYEKGFGEMEEKNVVSWTVVLDGVLKWEGSCSQSGNVVMGRWVHVYGLKMMGMEMDIMVETAMLDMYAKCGRIDAAIKVFKCMPRRNVVAWNAMLSGLAMHGRGRVVVEMFQQMIKEVRPDDLTFSCSKCLQSFWGGRLEEAETLINQMPISPNEVVLGSLLGSCNSHGKLQLAEHVLQKLIRMDPHNTEYHSLLSNMYTLAGKLDKANALRRVLKTKGIRKIPGMSSIQLRLAGYVPNLAAQVFPGSDGVEAGFSLEKEQALFSHSEKLAVCFGL